MPLGVKIQSRTVTMWSRGGDEVTVPVMMSAGRDGPSMRQPEGFGRPADDLLERLF
jgi:hypothetical protein